MANAFQRALSVARSRRYWRCQSSAHCWRCCFGVVECASLLSVPREDALDSWGVQDCGGYVDPPGSCWP
jgi:hypothetical protein